MKQIRTWVVKNRRRLLFILMKNFYRIKLISTTISFLKNFLVTSNNVTVRQTDGEIRRLITSKVLPTGRLGLINLLWSELWNYKISGNWLIWSFIMHHITKNCKILTSLIVNRVYWIIVGPSKLENFWYGRMAELQSMIIGHFRNSSTIFYKRPSKNYLEILWSSLINFAEKM